MKQTISAQKWFNAFTSLKDVVEGIRPEEVKHHTLDDTRAVLRDLTSRESVFLEDFDKSIEILEPFMKEWEISDSWQLQEDFRKLVDQWQEEPDKAPSIMALQAAFYHLRGYQPSDSPHMKSSLMTGVLATIKNDNPFHNNPHTREVMFADMVLLSQEEYVTKRKYSEDYVCSSVRIKQSHDLFHDGTHNDYTKSGKKRWLGNDQFRLERMPTEGITGYLRKCGLSEQEIKDDATVILFSDVSKEKSKLKWFLKSIVNKTNTLSPAELLRKISAHHAGNQKIYERYLPRALRLALSEEKSERYGEQTRGQYITGHAERLCDCDLLGSTLSPHSAAVRFKQLQKELPPQYPGKAGDGSYVGFLQFAYGGVSERGDFRPTGYSPAMKVLFEPRVAQEYLAAKARLAYQSRPAI